MSRINKSLAFIFLFILILSSGSATRLEKETVIYIVRHAEKDTKDPKNNDPDLNAEGSERARALNVFLRKEKISAVFSTNYKRTMQTAAPVARRNGIPVKTYESNNPESLVNLIELEFANKKILVTGHSNTILELVKAFGLAPPVARLNDDDYDLIFIVILQKGKEPELKIKRYGHAHHSTELAINR
jgi:2,3-bisphosphoglycerate-dependent phosphoglycerate mutase